MWRQVNLVDRFLILSQANVRLWERIGLGNYRYSPSVPAFILRYYLCLSHRTKLFFFMIGLRLCKLKNVLEMFPVILI